MSSMSNGYDPDNPPGSLTAAEDVTPAIIDAAYECAESAYGLGNDFRIDWERAYAMLESLYGFFVTEMASPADNKIRRAVNKRRRDEGLGTGSVES